MARNIDERDRDALDHGVRKAELDGDAALFLLLQPIGIDPGQRLHQRALPVIDMTGSADDDV